MTRDDTLLLLLGAGALAALYWYSQRDQSSVATGGAVTDFTQDPVSAVTDAVTTAVSGWRAANEGNTWMPYLLQAEVNNGIPAELLARLAYQESHFRDSVIRGTTVSPAGALGIMQMMPQYFSSVRAARPYTDDSVVAQINEAAGQLASLHTQLGSWPLALAGYNAGAGAVQKYGGIPPYTETQNYVAQILADVPAAANA